MGYDSALMSAQMTLNTYNIVPKEIVPGKHVNLDFDNIDFQEESGKQTHVTNGIIIQPAVDHEAGIISNVGHASQHVPIKKKTEDCNSTHHYNSAIHYWWKENTNIQCQHTRHYD